MTLTPTNSIPQDYANDALLLGTFQQAQQQQIPFQLQQQVQPAANNNNDHPPPQNSQNLSDSHSNILFDNSNPTNLDCDSNPTLSNMNPLGQQLVGGGGSSEQQQLLELMAAMTGRQSNVATATPTAVTTASLGQQPIAGLNSTTTANALLQQQLQATRQAARAVVVVPAQNVNIHQPTSQSVAAGNHSIQAQLATLLQTPQAAPSPAPVAAPAPAPAASVIAQNTLHHQQQQRLPQQRQHSLGLGMDLGFQPSQTSLQRQHSLSLGTLGNLEPQPQHQPQQHQQQTASSILSSLATTTTTATTNNVSSNMNNAAALLALQLGHQSASTSSTAINNTIITNPNTKPPAAVAAAPAAATTTTAATPSPSPASNSSSSTSKSHKQFLLFIKILLKCLDSTSNHILKERTKAIVAECTKRNRLGDPAYQPLQQAVEQQLRPVVGEQWWNRAQNYVQSYQTKQPQLKQRVARVRLQQQQQLALQRQKQQQMLRPIVKRL